MKGFWIKLVSIIAIAVMIIIYQEAAQTYASMEKEALDLKASIEEQIAEAEDQGARYDDGTYEGEGIGYSGAIRVRVTVSGGKIDDIEITETSDDKAYLEMAKKIIDEMIQTQAITDVDTVSGATFSSRGILDAVNDALKGAHHE